MFSRQALAVLALAVSVADIASAQDCGTEWTCKPLLDAVKPCPSACYKQETFGCDLDDWACRCTYKESVYVETETCVTDDCPGGFSDFLEAKDAFDAFCACVVDNGNPPACSPAALPSSSVVVPSSSVIASASSAASSVAPSSVVSSVPVVSASVAPSSSIPVSSVPISSFPVFSPSSSVPISSAPSSIVSSASAIPSDEPCTDDSESCIPPSSRLSTLYSYSVVPSAAVTSTTSESVVPSSTGVPSAAYPFTNSSAVFSYPVHKPSPSAGYPVGGGYPPKPSSPSGGYPGYYHNTTSTSVYAPVTSAVEPTTTCTDDLPVYTGAPGSDKPVPAPAPVPVPAPYPGSEDEDDEFNTSPDLTPVEEPVEETKPEEGAGSDYAPVPVPSPEYTPAPAPAPVPVPTAEPTRVSAVAPVASTSFVSPVQGDDDEYIVTAGVARGKELATGGAVFAAFVIALGLF